MELMQELELGVPVDETWAALTDLRRLTPCVPGARLHDADGEELRGLLDVKVGPIDAQYEGRSAFVELDEAEHRIVLSITGHDTHGQGDATASVTLDLASRPGGTLVTVVADLSVSGKVAQFGRGVLADVSADLMRQFIANLEAEVSGAVDASGAAPASAVPSETSGSTKSAEPTGSTGSTAGGSIAATAAAERGATEAGVRAAPRSVDVDTGDDQPEHASLPVRALAAVGAVVAVVAFGYLLKRRSTRARR